MKGARQLSKTHPSQAEGWFCCLDALQDSGEHTHEETKEDDPTTAHKLDLIASGFGLKVGARRDEPTQERGAKCPHVDVGSVDVVANQ